MDVSSRTERLASLNGYQYLIELRDKQRKQAENAVSVVKGAELPWEINPQGKMRWYMHPSIKDIGINTYLMFVQEIPGGSRSGRQRYQGGMVIHILEGRGYTLIDGVRHDWEAEDIVQLPLRPAGIVYQHFNSDPDKPVVFVACEPNYTDSLGVDRGSGFEQLEVAPEYGTMQRAAV